MKKKILLMLMTSALALGTATVAYAGQWQQNSTGWWYQNDDNSYPRNSWQWLNGKCYYFDSNGYMLANTTTPDGYNVDANGEWTVNGVVQTLGNVATQANTGAASGYNKDGISNVAIDLLHSNRDEANAKYGPEEALQAGYSFSISYPNVLYKVIWKGKSGAEAALAANRNDMSNYYINMVFCKKPTDMVNFLPERANSMKQDELKDLLRSMGYEAYSNGLACYMSLGDYTIYFEKFGEDTSAYIDSNTAHGR